MQSNRLLRLLALAGLIAGAVALAACGDTAPAGLPGGRQVPGGNVQQGRQAVIAYGCISCHSVPGVRSVGGVESHVGPPLRDFASRRFIAGSTPNTAENLVVWIQNPQAIRPGTAMPAVGVSEADARHIAAYLYEVD